jgi:hypothetical protein
MGKFVAGQNATIFAYGPTGSGKVSVFSYIASLSTPSSCCRERVLFRCTVTSTTMSLHQSHDYITLASEPNARSLVLTDTRSRCTCAHIQTHTMQGTKEEPGVIPRAVASLLKQVEEDKARGTYVDHQVGATFISVATWPYGGHLWPVVASNDHSWPAWPARLWCERRLPRRLPLFRQATASKTNHGVCHGQQNQPWCVPRPARTNHGVPRPARASRGHSWPSVSTRRQLHVQPAPPAVTLARPRSIQLECD